MPLRIWSTWLQQQVMRAVVSVCISMQALPGYKRTAAKHHVAKQRWRGFTAAPLLLLLHMTWGSTSFSTWQISYWSETFACCVIFRFFNCSALMFWYRVFCKKIKSNSVLEWPTTDEEKYHCYKLLSNSSVTVQQTTIQNISLPEGIQTFIIHSSPKDVIKYHF